ncbi:MAG: M48 family metallopeptidase [Candidatus Eremiobacteraeota bacterium]|nr:M48 family metallopeptidase [Candidatus Eremiobacteraeota bacterium]
MSNAKLRFGMAFMAIAALATFGARAQESGDESQTGAQLFKELKAQSEIVSSSPLYDRLRPIAANLTNVVQPQYAYPIHFYIVHEPQPNAFAAPGGNVYVTDALFYFVKNKEELQGVLCHETSHLLHHDSEKLMKDDQQIRARAIAATILLGPTIGVILATTAISQLDSLHYSRNAEEAADLTGADNCAKAGYNPWGLVWLFRDFSNANVEQPPELLSDHPDFEHRIAQLEQHFKQNPSLFDRFDATEQSATVLDVPKNEDESFLR